MRTALRRSYLLAAAVLLAGEVALPAATITKSGTGTDLTAGATWGGTAPGSGDVGTWSTGSLGGSLTLGTDVSWQGISIQDASADISVTGSGQFTLGTSGIAIATGAKNLSIGSRVNTGSSNQSWTIGSGRKLTVNGANVGAATLTIDGPGTIDVQGVFLTGGSNVFTSNGIVNQSAGTLNLLDTTDVIRLGHWTNSTGNQYNLSGGTLNALSTTFYNGWDGASAFSISGGTANLKGLALGGLSSASSLALTGGRLNIGTSGIYTRNTGGSRTINLGGGTVGAMGGNWSSSLAMTLTGTGGNVTFNTLDSADGSTARTITLNGGLSGTGGLIKGGAGTLRLTATNTFSGGLTVNAGKVEVATSPTWNVSTMGTGSITINSGATVDVQNVHVFGWNVGTNNNIVINGGTLAFGTNDNYIGNLTLTDNASVTGSAYFALAGGTLSYTGSDSSKQATIGTRVALGNISGAVNATFTVNGSNSSGDLVFSNYVYGGGKVTKDGTGTVVFSANNQYSGGTALNAGTIRLNYAENAGTSGPLGTATAVGSITLGGGTLQYTAANQYDYSGRFSTAASQQYKVDTNSQSVTWGTALTSSGGSLTKSGNGTLTLSQTNTYNGATAINGGTLNVTGSIASSAATVASGATLAGTGTVGNVTVSGGGILSPGASSAGTLTTGDLTFSGAANVTLGILAGAINSTVQVNGQLAANGGANSVTFALGTGLATLGTGTYSLLTYTGTQLSDVTAFTFSGTQGARQGVSVSNGTKAINLVVASTYPIWTGANSSDFSAAIGAGTTNWKLSGAGGDAAFITSDAVRFDSTASRGTVNLTADVAPASVVFEGDSLNYTLGSTGNFKVTAGQLTKSGSHNLTINNANTYSGGTVITGSGTVTLGNGGALGTGSVSLNGGTLALGGNSVANDITLGGGSITGSGTLSGTLSGGAFVKSDNSTLTLSGASNAQTSTTLSSGKLQVGSAGALGGASATLALNGGTLSSDSTTARSVTAAGSSTIGGNITLGDATNTGALTLAANFGLGGATRTLTTASNATLSGALSNGSLTKAGNGTLTLSSGSNTLTATTVSQGTLVASNNSAFGSGTLTLGDANTGASGAKLLISGGTFGKAFTVSSAATSGVVTFGANGASGLTEVNGLITLQRDLVIDGGVNTDRFTIRGGITGTGNLTIAGSGVGANGVGRVLFLNDQGGFNTNTFTGNLTVQSGAMLQLDYGSSTSASYIPDAAIVTVDGILKLAKGNNSETIGGLAGSGELYGHDAVANVASRLIIDSSTTNTFSGKLTNGGASGATLALTKQGTGTQVLTGANTYTGGTSLTNGVLEFANGSLGPSGTVAVSNATLRWASGNTQDISSRLSFSNGATATLDTNGNNVSFAGAIGSSTTSGLAKAGNGKLSLGATTTYSGATAISGGTLELTGSAQLGSTGAYAGNITFSNSSSLRFATSASQTLSGVLSGAGSLDKSGTGTLTLTNANTYTGATAVNNGTLTLAGSLAADSAVTVASGATLNGSGTAAGAVTVASGGILGSVASTGTLTLGSLDFGGSAVLNIGDLSNYASNAAFAITGAVNKAAGTVTLNLAQSTLDSGVYRLISFGSGITSASGFALGTGPVIGSRQVAVGLGYVAAGAGTPGYITYEISGANPVWTGTVTVGGKAYWKDSDATATNWTAAGLATYYYNSAASSNGTADSVMFNDTATGTTDITLDDTVTPVSVTFANTTAKDYTLTGSGSIAGASTTLSKSGNGTLTIGTANTFAGGTTLSAGTLRVADNAALGTGALTISGGRLAADATARSLTPASITFAGNATLGASGSGALTLSGNVNLGGGTRTLTVDSAVTLSGAVSNGGLTKAGNATLALSGNLSGLGGTIAVSAGTLRGAFAQKTVDIASGATLSLTDSGSVSASGSSFTGAGTLDYAGGGTLTLSGTLGGALQVSSGTVKGTSAGSFGSGAVTVLSGGALDLAGVDRSSKRFNLTLAGTGVAGSGALFNSGAVVYGNSGIDSVTLSDDATIVVSGSGQAQRFDITDNNNGKLYLANHTLTKAGNGTLIIKAGVGSAGTIRLDAGAIGLENSFQGADTANVAIRVASGATLSSYSTSAREIRSAVTLVGTGATVSSGGSSATLWSNLVLDGGGTLDNSNVSNNTVTGVSGTGNLVISGGQRLNVRGTWTFDAAQTSEIQVNAGYLEVNGGALTTNGVLNLGSGVNASFGVDIWAGALTVGGLKGSGAITANGAGGNAFSGTAIIIDTASGQTNTYSGVLKNGTWSGAALAIEKKGAGTQVLSGASTRSGATLLTAGTLAVGNDAALGSGGVTVNGGALSSADTAARSLGNNLTFGGDATLGDATASGALTFSGTVGLGGATRTLTVASAVTFSNTVSNGGLTKAGNGTLTLTGTNTYAGGTTVSAGNLVAGADAAFGTGLVTVDGGTVDFGGRAVGNSISFLSGAITGAGGLTGSIALSGSSLTFASLTSFGGASLNVGVGATLDLNDLNPTNAITLSGGTLLRYGNWKGPVSLAGTVDATLINSLTSNTVTVGAGANVDLTGVTKDIVYTGGTLSNLSGYAGTVTVRGALDLTGGTPASAGTVRIESGSVDFGNGTFAGTVQYLGGTVANYAGAINVIGTNVSLTSANLSGANLVLTAGNTAAIGAGLQGNIRLEGGSVVGNDLNNLTGTVTVAGTQLLDLGGSPGNYAISNAGLSIVVENGATLKGTASVGAITAQAGSILAPGNSPGQFLADSLKPLGGSVYDFEIRTIVDGIGLPGVAGFDYDTITVAGELDLTGLSVSSQLLLNLITLDMFNTNSTAEGWDPATAFELTLYSYGTLKLNEGATLSELFNINSDGFLDANFASVFKGHFSVVNDTLNNEIHLVYSTTAIPEPSTYGLALGGLALVAAAVRRRKNSK